MCYFFGQRVSKDTFIKLLHIQKELGTLAALETLNDGFRYGDISVLIANGDNDLEERRMHWEFIAQYCAHTVSKYFKTLLDPTMPYKYVELPEIVINGKHF